MARPWLSRRRGSGGAGVTSNMGKEVDAIGTTTGLDASRSSSFPHATASGLRSDSDAALVVDLVAGMGEGVVRCTVAELIALAQFAAHNNAESQHRDAGRDPADVAQDLASFV